MVIDVESGEVETPAILVSLSRAEMSSRFLTSQRRLDTRFSFFFYKHAF